MSIEVLSLLLFCFVGILAGIIGGLLGLSGGVITVPCLIFIFRFLDFPSQYIMHMAVATSLASLMVNGLLSTWSHHKHQGVVWDIFLSMIPGTFIGCVLGALIANEIPSEVLEVIFGVFICILAVYVLLQKKKVEEKKKLSKMVYASLGFAVGTLSSLLGVGGGTFTVPLLLSRRFPTKLAIGTSAAISTLITTISALTYLYLGEHVVTMSKSIGYIYLPAFIVITITTTLMAPIGTKLAYLIEGRLLRKIFAGTLIITGISMIYR